MKITAYVLAIFALQCIASTPALASMEGHWKGYGSYSYLNNDSKVRCDNIEIKFVRTGDTVHYTETLNCQTFSNVDKMTFQLQGDDLHYKGQAVGKMASGEIQFYVDASTTEKWRFRVRFTPNRAGHGEFFGYYDEISGSRESNDLIYAILTKQP